jgi:tripartite-type tricarboxylate transporter receptor subunit TctC
MGGAMKIRRRRFLHLAAGAAALPALSRVAWSQTYPARQVRLIVGFSPGGVSDILARLVGQLLSERLGQQFVIENRLGAGSNIATEAAVRSSPDGYTLLMVTSTNAINASLYGKLAFNFIRDIAPVAMIMRGISVMLVNPAFPAKTVPELIAYPKANPGTINVATPGIGTPQHLSSELFKTMAGVNIVHVHYRGGPPALTDLIGGQIQVAIVALATSIEYIRAGTQRGLAVTSATRFSALPDIPTVAEYVPGFEESNWFGVSAPKGTPVEIIDRLNREINAGFSDPKMKSRLADLGCTVIAGSPADLEKLIAEDTEKWAKVIRSAGIKAE